MEGLACTDRVVSLSPAHDVGAGGDAARVARGDRPAARPSCSDGARRRRPRIRAVAASTASPSAPIVAATTDRQRRLWGRHLRDEKKGTTPSSRTDLLVEWDFVEAIDGASKAFLTNLTGSSSNGDQEVWTTLPANLDLDLDDATRGPRAGLTARSTGWRSPSGTRGAGTGAQRSRSMALSRFELRRLASLLR